MATKSATLSLAEIKQVKKMISDKFTESEVMDDSHLYEDLNISTLERLEIIMEMEHIFNVDLRHVDLESIQLVSDLYNIL